MDSMSAPTFSEESLPKLLSYAFSVVLQFYRAGSAGCGQFPTVASLRQLMNTALAKLIQLCSSVVHLEKLD